MSSRVLQFIDRYRASKGADGHELFDKKSGQRQYCLLLSTLHHETGDEHTRPVLYFRSVDDRLFIAASNGGAAYHPTWFRNLCSTPVAVVQLGDEIFDATASVLDGAERVRFWSQLTSEYGLYAEYQTGLEGRRVIPLIELSRCRFMPSSYLTSH